MFRTAVLHHTSEYILDILLGRVGTDEAESSNGFGIFAVTPACRSDQGEALLVITVGPVPIVVGLPT